MKLSIPILILLTLLLTSCLKELIFVGEGEKWTAEVTVSQTDGDETYQIQLTYKGDDYEEVGTFSYYVESSNNGVVDFGSNEATLNEKGIYQTRTYGSNSPSTSRDAELVLKVEWEGKNESIILKNE
jgi:hypothetical protein